MDLENDIMDTTNAINKSKKDVIIECGMQLWHMQQFHHRYLLDIPNLSRNELPFCSMELPYPIFNPDEISDYHIYREVFKSTTINTQLEYCKKLYAKEHKKKLKNSLQNEFVVLPRYIIEMAQGAFDHQTEPPWWHTGGTLKTFLLNNELYVARAHLKQEMRITNVNNPDISLHIEVDENGPMYNIKSCQYNEGTLLGVRHKYNLSLLYLTDTNEGLKNTDFWTTKSTSHPFIDMTFNEFIDNEFSTINDVHKFKVIDLTVCKSRLDYTFSHSDNINDCLAQIIYTDPNTVCYMNRKSIRLLDLRSLATKKLNIEESLLKCDDFCTITKSKLKKNDLIVSSFHSCMNFDVRFLQCTSKIKHMLSNPPFMSSLIENTDDYEHICLFSHNITDRVMLHKLKHDLTLPSYIPNPKDSLTEVSLTHKIQFYEALENRLSLPVLGMELFRDKNTNDICLYSSTYGGDVFKQKLVQTSLLDSDENLNSLWEWCKLVRWKPKQLECTSICNLGKAMSTITTGVPCSKTLKKLMKENTNKELFEAEFSSFEECLKGTVGEAMNSIWGADIIDTEADLASQSVSPKQKVSEWLSNID